MLNSINQFCKDYYTQIPSDGFKAACLSSAFSFAASVLVISFTTPVNQMPNLSRAGLAAGISFLAACIHAITTPIFNYLLDNPNNDFNGFYELFKECINITLAHLLINHATPFKVNLITAYDWKNENIVLCSNVLRISLDIAFKALNALGLNGLNALGLNQYTSNTTNPSPIYMTV